MTKITWLAGIASALILGGCAATVNSVAVRPSLPEPPVGFGEPVQVPAARAGDDARQYAARAVVAARGANRRLLNDRLFYNDLRKGLR